MYYQIKDGKLSPCVGNVEFSATVYQTAASLTDKQKTAFGVVWVEPTPQPSFNPLTHRIEEAELMVGETSQRWELIAFPPDVAAAKTIAAAKAARAAQVDAITVTTAAGHEYDGNEDAQRRMTSAITAMDDGDTLPWVLHDNTVAVVGRAELREALRLAGASMAAIWVAPYTQP